MRLGRDLQPIVVVARRAAVQHRRHLFSGRYADRPGVLRRGTLCAAQRDAVDRESQTYLLAFGRLFGYREWRVPLLYGHRCRNALPDQYRDPARYPDERADARPVCR